jgi:predicted ABC-type ATPase
MPIYQTYESIPDWVRLDVAIEIIAEMISTTRQQLRLAKENQNKTFIKEQKKRLDVLRIERLEMYFGNKEVIKKIICKYGPIVRRELEDKIAFMDAKIEISRSIQENIYAELIKEMEFYTKPVGNPEIVILGGQPGCGKAGLISLSKELFPDGNVFILNGDELRKEHPHSSQILKQNEQHYATLTDVVVRDWTSRLFTHALETKRNIIFEGTMRTDQICRTIEDLFHEDYKITIQVMAVSEKAQIAYGRMTPLLSHQDAYHGLLQTIEKIEKDQMFDTLQVLNREKEVLYDNSQQIKMTTENAKEAIVKTRTQRWSTQKRNDYIRCWDEVLRLMEYRHVSKQAIEEVLLLKSKIEDYPC